MPHSFEIDIERRIVLFRATGRFSSDELLGCLQEVIADPSFERDFDHLVDLREVTHFGATSSDMRKRTAADRELEPEIDSSRIAIVSADDVVFGMSRMYEQLMEDAPPVVRTFRSIGEAATWLGVPESIADWE